MRNVLSLILVFFPLVLFSQTMWKDLAVTENTEIYVDASNIKEVNGIVYATTKTIYTTQDARTAYLEKLKRAFSPKNVDKKIAKWDGFSYTVTKGIYDCQNKRFKIIEVEDYKDDNTLIVRTKTKEDKSKWLDVDVDTVGDYVLFYICDYENR